uniref:Ig-like domain-containing protein n=1 Tax=Oryzias melastigma TaxID=30732 RepID=A0A3B3DRN9_ORYME
MWSLITLFFFLITHCKSVYLLSVYIGDSVTLPCSFASSSKHLSWYQQRVGEQPQIISSIYKRSNSNSFYKPFDNRRFSVHTGGELYSLSISDVQNSDSAMYYCGHTSITVTEFDRGTFLMVKGSSSWRSHRAPGVSTSCSSDERLVLRFQLQVVDPGARLGLDSELHANQDSPTVQYVALDFKLRRQTSRIQRSTEESVYSAVRGSH